MAIKKCIMKTEQRVKWKKGKYVMKTVEKVKRKQKCILKRKELHVCFHCNIMKDEYTVDPKIVICFPQVMIV